MRLPQSGIRIDSPAWPLLQAHISYQDVTTADGNAGGTTLVCAGLANEPSYDGLALKILSGGAAGQVRTIEVHGAASATLVWAVPFHDSTGAIQQITAGTRFVILSSMAGGGGPGPAPAEGLTYYGIVDAVPGANQFTIDSLTGLGAGKFIGANPYVAFVLRDAGGAGAAPQGELQAITAYVTATGAFTTGAFTAAVAVGDEILIIHPAVMATLTGVAIAGYPDGIVYFNDTDGGAGVAWPVGTADNPSNDEASTLAILTTYGLRKISVYSRAASFVLSGAMVGYEFIGHGQYTAMDTIDLAGRDITTSVFRWLNINGAMGGAGLATFDNCNFLATNVNGMLKQCLIQTMSLMAGATLDAYDCGAWQGAATITPGTPAPMNLYGWKGDLILDAQTGGITNIYALGGTITINVTCNGGTINIYGHAIIVDNSAVGCTVNDYTINNVPAADAATNVQLRDVAGNKTDAATLDDMSALATASLVAEAKRILLRMSGAGIFSATVQGAARTELDTMLEQIATYFVAAAGALSVTIDPGGAARTSLATLWNDLGAMLAGAGITTWPASAPPGNGVSFAEAIRQIYDDLIAKSGVQDVVIYPVAEDADVAELADDGSAPAYYPAVAHSTAANAEGAPGVAWSEDIDFEQAGTINVISIYAEIEWQTRFLVGAGAGTQSSSKIQISRDGGASWVDLTDNFNNVAAVMTTRNREGVGRWVGTIVAGANQLMFRLVHWTDDAGGVSTSEAQIRSNFSVRITYRKS